jgi:hypothetical protein
LNVSVVPLSVAVKFSGGAGRGVPTVKAASSEAVPAPTFPEKMLLPPEYVPNWAK